MTGALAIALALQEGTRERMQGRPPHGRTVARKPAGTWRRRVGKVRTAAPIAFRVFRRVAALPPAHTTPQVGQKVVFDAPRSHGRIEEVIIGLETGRATLAVSSPSLKHDYLLLLPADATQQQDGVVRADRIDTVAVPRELALSNR